MSFLKMKLRLQPTPKQHLAYQAWDDPNILFLLFGGGAGGGKSWWICEKRIKEAYQFAGIKSFIARKELKRLMASTFVTFTKVCQHYQVPKDDWKLNGQYNYIEFKNGSRIDLLDVDYQPADPLFERLGSLEYTNGDIEEAGEIHSMAFDVLKSRVGRHMNKEFGIGGKIGLTANPTKNFLYSLFYRPHKEGRLPKQYCFIQSLYGDNEYTAQEYGKMLSEIKDKSTLERLKYGNWEYDADPSVLIEYDAIIDFFTNVGEEGKKYLTADIARYGQDKTVIGCWDGLKLYKIIEAIKKGIDETANLIRNTLTQENIPRSQGLVDEDGIGGGVVDILKGIKGFIANSSPLDEQHNAPVSYRNLKAQCSYLLADKMNQRKMACAIENEAQRQAIIEELQQIRSKDADKDNKRQVMPKEDVKERIQRSPDFSDMIMMRMYFELTRPANQAAHVYIPQPHINVSPPKLSPESVIIINKGQVHVPKFR